MNRHEELLNRLAGDARREVAPGGTNEIPHGLATRVLAQVQADAERDEAWSWEKLTIRAVPVAAALLVICALVVLHAHPVATKSPGQLADDIFTEALNP
ncbi:MAG: hypothetical protein MUF81_05600 [Verrucomicrobia bacterium]|jgi:hypothetical protein|nr:hypothetical protein [Verrucomicrobiota bacterium]